MESKVLADALFSVREPVEQFIKTGLYSDSFNGDYMPKDVVESSGFISDQQTRRVARMVAKELKRPFIIMSPVINGYKWENINGRWQREAVDPKFSHAWIEVPKKKYLLPIVNPLILAENGEGMKHRHRETLWCFEIYNGDFWNEYRAAMDRPEMRIARKMKPL
jgi:hypothetical protein